MDQRKLTKSELKEFIIHTNLDNIHRIRYLIITLGAIQFLQMLFYLFGTTDEAFDYQLITIKGLIVLAIIVILTMFHLAKKRSSFLYRHVEVLVFMTVFILLILAITNTFKAQSITSDISIYILVVFAIVAAVRLRFFSLVLLFSLGYGIFAIGISFYQSEPALITSHIMNGLIVNILAFVTGYMFYNYSLQDFIDKLELKEMSEKDSLTGLLNHGAINHKLSKSLQKNTATHDSLYVALLDLDYFKEINDSFGHRFGDSILKDVSTSMHALNSDSITCGRYGGDEFMIIVTDKNHDEVYSVFINLLLEINTIRINGTPLTYSCGIIKNDNYTIDQLVEKADQAMYKAKKQGRNQIVFSKD